MTQEKAFYTDDELVQRLTDKEAVKDLMARHAYAYGNDQRREELSELWVQTPMYRRTASLGNNFGYYVGIKEISNYYVVQNSDRRYEQLKPYCKANPALECSNRNLGLGVMNHHTANTVLCYLAEDGKTAKYMAYDCGEETVGKPDGTANSYFVFGIVYADLVKENGSWKIWHLTMTHDHTIPAGVEYADFMPILAQPGDDPIEAEFGTPTVTRTVYNPFFGWEYLYQDMPKPYITYTDLASYGPEGNLGYNYFERERREIQ